MVNNKVRKITKKNIIHWSSGSTVNDGKISKEKNVIRNVFIVILQGAGNNCTGIFLEFDRQE